MYTIYGLRDPRDFQIRYIGMTENHPMWRLAQHCHDRRDGSTAKVEWITELRALRRRPDVVVLEYISTRKHAVAAELYWIGVGVKSGWPLVNQEAKIRHNPHRRPVTPPQTLASGLMASSKWLSRLREYVIRHLFPTNPPPSFIHDERLRSESVDEQVHVLDDTETARMTQPSLPSPGPSTIECWLEWVLANYLPQHLELMTTDKNGYGVGIMDLARAMAMERYGTPDRADDIKGHASKVAKRIRNEAGVQGAGGVVKANACGPQA